jgi:hypothetical protein
MSLECGSKGESCGGFGRKQHLGLLFWDEECVSEWILTVHWTLRRDHQHSLIQRVHRQPSAPALVDPECAVTVEAESNK